MTEHLLTLIAGQWRDASGQQYTTEYGAGLIVNERAVTLHRIAADIGARFEEQAQLQRLDNSKPIGLLP